MKQYLHIQTVSSCLECPNYDPKMAMGHEGCLALDRLFLSNEDTTEIIDDCPLDDY